MLANCGSGLIIAFGIIAALDQLHIATNVVNAVLYAALAALVGVIVVAVGGGGIRTMSRRWEMMAARYDEEKPRIAAASRRSPSMREQAEAAAQRMHPTDETRVEPAPQHTYAPVRHPDRPTEQFPSSEGYRGDDGGRPPVGY